MNEIIVRAFLGNGVSIVAIACLYVEISSLSTFLVYQLLRFNPCATHSQTSSV